MPVSSKVPQRPSGSRLAKSSAKGMVQTVPAALGLFGDHLAELKWFVRDKTYLPKEIQGIVVDVGAGHSPHFRAHILIDKFPNDGSHRIGKPIVRRHRQSLLVWADVEKLPIKDKGVAFTIASHLLEHLPHPGRALDELVRVGHAGYIECPARWSETLFPYSPHLWYVALEEGRLVFAPKLNNRDRYLEDVFLPELGRRPAVRHLFRNRAFWTVRTVWVERCAYSVTGEPDHVPDFARAYARRGLADALAKLISGAVGRFVRPSSVSEEELISVFCCPECKGDLGRGNGSLICSSCRRQYLYQNRTIDFEHPTLLA